MLPGSQRRLPEWKILLTAPSGKCAVNLVGRLVIPPSNQSVITMGRLVPQ
jgi:hypothetical protein